MPKPLQNRIALVTGASRGIGQAVAKRFAKEGAQVILIARDVKGLEETDDEIRSFAPSRSQMLASLPLEGEGKGGGGNGATLVQLDLLEPEKIELLAAQIAQRFGKLDILVGNAGDGGILSPVPDIEPEDWNKVIALNVTANYHLIRTLHPLLLASGAGRAMFVSSRMAHGVHPYWGAYAASKAALEAMVITYAAENMKTPLCVNLIDPGIVRTRLRAQAFPGEDPLTLPEPEAITGIFVKLAGTELKETGKKFYAE